MTYPAYTVTIINAKDKVNNNVTIDGSHAFDMVTANGPFKMEFTHNNEGEDKIPSLIVTITTP